MRKIYFTKEFRKLLGRDFLITNSSFDLEDSHKFIRVFDGTVWTSINKNMILAIVDVREGEI